MPARHLELFSNLVEQIYLAALEPSAWPKAMGLLAGLQHSTSAVLFTPTTLPSDGGYVIAHGVTEEEFWWSSAVPTGQPEQGVVPAWL